MFTFKSQQGLFAHLEEANAKLISIGFSGEFNCLLLS